MDQYELVRTAHLEEEDAHMDVSELREVRQLCGKNPRLERLVADLTWTRKS